MLTLYVYVGIMTIPALDQYLAIGQSTLLLTIHGKRRERKSREEEREGKWLMIDCEMVSVHRAVALAK